jgi:hypothetical protein
MLNQAQIGKGQREYIEGVYQIYQNAQDFYKYIDKKTEKEIVNYRGRLVTIEKSPNPSLAFGSLDGGDLATPSNPQYDNLTVSYYWMNSGLEQSYGAILNNGKETVTDMLKLSVKSSAKQFAQWLNYYTSNGNGTTRLATTSAAYNGASPTVAVCNGATDTIGAMQIVDGMRLMVFDPTGTTQRVGTVGAGALTVSSHTNTTITFSTNLPSDYLSGDILVPETSTGSALGIKGVPFIVNDSGSYFGLSRSSVSGLKSTVITASAALSAALLMRTFNQTVQKAGRSEDEDVSWLTMATAITQHAAYYGLTTATGNTHFFAHTAGQRPGIDVGGSSMNFTWFGAPIKRFFWFPGNAIYFLDLNKKIKMAVLKEVGQLLNMPASEWMQAINGSTNTYKAARQMWMDFAGDLYSPEPHLFGCLGTLDIANLPQQKA